MSDSRTHDSGSLGSTLKDPLVIDGRYRVDDVIGEGGMGVVYRATQLSIDRPVAVKLLRRGFAAEPQMVERFRQEAALIARLAHPNIVTIVDFGRTAEGDLFLAMEFVRGELLRERLAREGRLAVDDAVAIVAQILAALEHAHAKDIVHRDLKPSNVMLAEGEGHANFVKLLDFGIAKLIDRVGTLPGLTRTGFIVGTSTYMAPEQARGEAVDGRIDLYAAGVILYELIAGQPPFVADSETDVIRMHMATPPRPFDAALRARVPERVQRIIERALAKVPDMRFQTAREMRLVLEGRVELKEPVAVTRDTGAPTRAVRARGRESSVIRGEVEPTNERASRRRRLWVAGIVVGAVATGSAALYVGFPSRDPAPTNSNSVSNSNFPASAPAPAPAPATATASAPAPASAPATASATVPAPVPKRVSHRRGAENAEGMIRSGISRRTLRLSGESFPSATAPAPARADPIEFRVCVRCDGKPCYATVSIDGAAASKAVYPGCGILSSQKGGFVTLTASAAGFDDGRKRVFLLKGMPKVTIDLGSKR